MAEHGTNASYGYGCRCDLCRDARAQYQRRRRERIDLAKGKPWTREDPVRPKKRPERRHGTTHMYGRGCRCNDCIEARSGYDQDRRSGLRPGTTYREIREGIQPPGRYPMDVSDAIDEIALILGSH
jgi:hypothetical protein